MIWSPTTTLSQDTTWPYLFYLPNPGTSWGFDYVGSTHWWIGLCPEKWTHVQLRDWILASN